MNKEHLLSVITSDEFETKEDVIKFIKEYKEGSIFDTLSAINVNEHVEEKNGLKYLSWAWAWDTVMRIFPRSYSTVYETENGMPYWTDGKTAWVKVGFTIVDDEHPLGVERKEYFPILDYRNKSITVDKLTSFDMNTAVQRGLTKAIARHGLGFYIYAGEDLPQEDIEKKKNDKIEELSIELSKLQIELTDLGINFREDEKFQEFVKKNAKVKTTDTGKLDVDGMERLVAVYKAVIKRKKDVESVEEQSS